jgi:WD40 repeat protein
LKTKTPRFLIFLLIVLAPLDLLLLIRSQRAFFNHKLLQSKKIFLEKKLRLSHPFQSARIFLGKDLGIPLPFPYCLVPYRIIQNDKNLFTSLEYGIRNYLDLHEKPATLAMFENHDPLCFIKFGRPSPSKNKIERRVDFFDDESRKELTTIEMSKWWVDQAAISPDRKLLAIKRWRKDKDSCIEIYDVASGHLVKQIKLKDVSYLPLAFSPNGMILAFAGINSDVELYEVGSWKPIISLKGHSDKVEAIAFSPKDNILASGSDDRTIKLWDLSNKKVLTTLNGHKSHVLALAFSPDGQWLVSSGADYTIRFWHVWSGIAALVINREPSYHIFDLNLSFAPDGKSIYLGHCNARSRILTEAISNEFIRWTCDQD